MEVAELRLKSVEVALEWTKQIIALASGILVISGTFIKDLFDGKIYSLNLLMGCWISLCVCILFGLLFMGSLCSLLAQRKVRDVSIYSQPAQSLGFVHFAAFFIAMVLFAIFSLTNITGQSPSDLHPNAEASTNLSLTVSTNLPTLLPKKTNVPGFP